MDKVYSPKGDPLLEQTPFHITNENMMRVVEQYPDLFIPVISVHPYRRDAVEELARWAARGVKFIKWLPNSMGIDPSHPLTTRFYQAMLEHNMILLTHTGEESAVASENQRFGNPLLLRKPLDMGVQVVALHAATDGDGEDFDNPGECLPNYELLLRLLRTPAYHTNLRAEISASTVYNRMDCLEKLLGNTEIHDRLINGSDYPIPAINCVIWLKRLERLGFITRKERHLLKEIYQYNPLLFDFVLKRTLRHPETGARFADKIFESPF
jgi:mannonate dehydratase